MRIKQVVRKMDLMMILLGTLSDLLKNGVAYIVAVHD